MVQGGGLTAAMDEKPTRAPILNEATNGLRNMRGTLAMARMRALRSATSQFYVNVSDNASLDHRGYSPDDFGYAVFGRVLSGMDVIDKIAATPTGTKGDHEDVPVTPVVINKVSVVKAQSISSQFPIANLQSVNQHSPSYIAFEHCPARCSFCF